jgi:AcrR family transcriptional regulator
MTTSQRRRRARRGDGDLLRDEIVAAASRLLAETGDEEAVSIRGVAQAVGVTPPSIYLHFPDKTTLMFAVCEERFAALDRVSREAAATASDPLDELRRRGEAYIRFGLDNPAHYRILFMGRAEPPSYDETRLRDASAFGGVVDAVERGMEAGMIAAGDPHLAAVGLWATVHGITSLMIAKPHFPWPPLDALIDHVLCARFVALAAPSRP